MAKDRNKVIQSFIDSAARTAVMLDCDVEITRIGGGAGKLGANSEPEILVMILKEKKD